MRRCPAAGFQPDEAPRIPQPSRSPFDVSPSAWE